MLEGIVDTLTELTKTIVFGISQWSGRVFSGLSIQNNWFVVLDIMLVAFILYWFLKRLQDSKSFRILYGILFLVVLFALGHILNLLTLNWLIKYLTMMIIVALVVIFQPELREALANLGRWGRGELSEEKISFGKKLKKICFGNLGLKFLSLILAAGLWLYAATVENKIDYLPGTIPVEAENLAPTLAPVYDQDEVKVKISASSSVWKKITLEDFQAFVDLEKLGLGTHEVDVKVTSSIPGVQIVTIEPEKIRIRIEPAVTANVNVVPKFEGQLAAGYQIIETKIDPDEVEAKGAKGVIENIVNATVVIQVQGQDRDFTKKIKLTAFDEFDKTIKSVIFTPELVEVQVVVGKEGGGKLVGIKPKIKGSPASGYWVSGINTEPSSVRVIGSETKLKDLDYLETDTINIFELKQSHTFEVKLVLPSAVSLQSGEPETIQVLISISANNQAREIIAGLSFTNLGAGLTVKTVTPSSIKVMVTGPSQLLASLSSDNVVITFNLSGKGVGSHLMTITRDLISSPQGVAISSFVPGNVTIKIE